jgi:hypothetical protein
MDRQVAELFLSNVAHMDQAVRKTRASESMSCFGDLTVRAVRYSSSNSSLESQALQPVNIPALVELQSLLPGKIPSVTQERQDAVLVHGDFKVDNLIFGNSGSSSLIFEFLSFLLGIMTLAAGVAAIVDFELAALGSRWGDVCYFLMYFVFESTHELP